MRVALTLSLVFMQLIALNAQFTEGRLASKDFYTEIPFTYENNKIVIEAEMKGVKGRYLLDTGAMCILFKDSTEHYFVQSNTITINDAAGHKKKAEYVSMPHITVGDLRYENIPTLYVDMFQGPFKCFHYKGIIGSNLLRFGAFKIDWEKQVLIITDQYQRLGLTKKEGIKLMANKVQSSPFLSLKVNDVRIKDVLIDTGSGDSFTMDKTNADKLRQKGKINPPAYVSSGTNSHGAWGAGDFSREIFADVKLMVGKVILPESAIESSSESARIGMQLLELGDFVLDYPQNRFFFMPSNKDLSLTITSFGIDLIMEGEQFIVNGVWQ